LVDGDGVLFDFEARIAEALYKVAKIQINRSAGAWDIFEHPNVVPHAAALRAEVDKPGFCAGMGVLPGAIEGLTRLSEVSEVVVVTAPWRTSPTWAWERAVALEKHFGVTHDQIHSTSGKHHVRGLAIVDDRPANVVKWIAHHPNGFGFLWDQPHNRNDPQGRRLSPEICRTSSWGIVRDLFLSWARD
jgi:5'(3')-deoxyribonucleotidase